MGQLWYFYKYLTDDLNVPRVTQHNVLRIPSQDQRGDLISSVDDDPTFLNRIITEDKTRCFLYNSQLKLQSATCKTPWSPLQDKPRHDRSKRKVMLELLFFSSNEIVHIEFIPEGATVNKTRYKEIAAYSIQFTVGNLSFGVQTIDCC
jgi:Transposase.